MATASQLGILLNQIRWITRLSVALSSSLEEEDVYSVLISGMLSPLGLGYSNALAFHCDGEQERVFGKFCVGIATQEEARELQEELESESEFLERRSKELRESADTNESAAEELRTLEMSSHWVTVFQRLGTENAITERLQSFSAPLKATGSDGGAFFRRALSVGKPELILRREVEGELPAAVADLFAEEFALVPLKTSAGLQGVLILDRRLDNAPITDQDLEALDWFATQGALAMQNAQLIADLETAYQELKAVESMKSNFLSTISHELRTPLTAITGFVDLVLKGKVGDINDTQRNLLGRVAKNTGHLNNMVNDLIEVAEIEAEGMRDIFLEPVDPLQALFSVLPKLDYRRRDKRVDVEPVFDLDPPRIICDPRALERILFHLLDNAVKFSPSDDCVQVEFREVEGGRKLAIGIRDRGVGIAEDKLKRIFDQFYQIDNSMTRAHEGMGLGLSVTKMLVSCTRGQIDVESRENHGSCFTVTYPTADGESGGGSSG